MTNNPKPEATCLVHLGCGPLSKAGAWRDYDGSWNAWINCLPGWLRSVIRAGYRLTGREALTFPAHIRYLNLLHRLPFADNSVDAIYASHVWEHLYLDDARRATAECLRVLRPGGVIRLAVPDLRALCEEYLADQAPNAALRLNQKMLFRESSQQRNWLLKLYHSFADLHSHKFMYDAQELAALLTEIGFVQAAERALHDSRIPLIAQVERAGRVGQGAGIVVEAVKR